MGERINNNNGVYLLKKQIESYNLSLKLHAVYDIVFNVLKIEAICGMLCFLFDIYIKI